MRSLDPKIVDGKMGFVGRMPGHVYRMGSPKVPTSASGTSLTLSSAAAPLTALTLYGKSEQETTTGKNILPPERSASIDVDISANTDIYIVTDGTPSNGGNVFCYDADGNIHYAAMDIGDIERKYVFSADIVKIQNMLIEGVATAFYVREKLPYEPYTGGQPSPNPDYPQEIVSVGDDGEIGVNVYGGNLLHLPDGNMGKYISISNDIITINSGARGRSNFMQIPEMVFNPNKYTMSIVPLDNIDNDGTFQFAFRISVDNKVNDYVVSSTGWYMGGVVQGTNGQDTIEITDKITAKYFNVDIVKGDFTGQRFKIVGS